MVDEGGGERTVSDSSLGALGPLQRRWTERKRARRSRKKAMPYWQEFPLLVAIAIVLALVVKTYFVQAFYIPSGSMQNTLQLRDRVLVNKLIYKIRAPRRGEVVVFNAEQWEPEVGPIRPHDFIDRGIRGFSSAIGIGPPGKKDYIKRVIGLPGETVQCCDDHGRVTVNRRPLNEPYIFQNTPIEQRAFGPITVPAGRLWVMGDHRGYSQDSRAHQGDPWHGTIRQDHVVGRAFVIAWPVDRAAGLPVPATLQNSAVVLRNSAGGIAGFRWVFRHSAVLPLLPLSPVAATVLRRRRR